MLWQRQPVPGKSLAPCCWVLQRLWHWQVLSTRGENPVSWPGCAHAHTQFFCICTLGQRIWNQFPDARPPWNWGLPRFIAIWHPIWRPDLGNASGLCTINHVRSQWCYLQQELPQEQPPKMLTKEGFTLTRVLWGTGYSIAGELHGNAGTKTHSDLFVSNKPSPKRLQITFPAAWFSVPPEPCSSVCTGSDTSQARAVGRPGQHLEVSQHFRANKWKRKCGIDHSGRVMDSQMEGTRTQCLDLAPSSLRSFLPILTSCFQDTNGWELAPSQRMARKSRQKMSV